MKGTGFVVLVYGLLLCLGGTMGYIKAESLVSLVSGLFFGSIALFASLALFLGKRGGAITAIVLSLILDAFFTYRYLFVQKFMPAGLMSLLSLIVLVVAISALRKKKKSQ